eukprot:TRINITY_DN1277_c0_g1_i7.p1 TRINITY_DN1277_c0_g1~~TRINITY_DN1277_c0_g1_i7.p1  ORF type:complete len:348 (-),score=33.15 TRINITY_DN1277_c0_g1_i7:186-1229(-)
MDTGATKWSSERPIITAFELNELLQKNEPSLRIVNSTYPLTPAGGVKQDAYGDYARERIRGAAFFNFLDEIKDQNSKFSTMLPSETEFSAHMKRLDISNTDLIVVYDHNKNLGAGRGWWMFRAFGHQNVYFLDGGLSKWKAEGFPLESGEPKWKHRNLDDSAYTFKLNPEHVRNIHQVQIESYKLKNGLPTTTEIVDARPPENYLGTAPSTTPGMRSGHIPGSKNVWVSDLMNPDGTYKTAEEIRKIITEKQVDLNKNIITTCGIGVTACLLEAGFHLINHKKTSMYDGSWNEWGQTPEYVDEEISKLVQERDKPWGRDLNAILTIRVLVKARLPIKNANILYLHYQ